MKALLVRSKLIYSFLMGVAQSLVKYANVIESHLPEDYKFESDSADKNSIETPPAHWLEKVRLGAPHILEQNTYGNGQHLFSAQTENETGVNASIATPSSHWLKKIKQKVTHLLTPYTSSNESDNCSSEPVEAKQTPKVSYSQKNKLKQKSAQQLFYKKSNKVFASFNGIFRQSRKEILMPTVSLERNTAKSARKINKKTVTKKTTTINKATDVSLADKSSNIDNENIDELVIKKTFNNPIIDTKPISQTTASENLSAVGKTREHGIRFHNQISSLTEHALLNNNTTIHLYPRSSSKTNTKQFFRGNEIKKEKFEWNKPVFSVNDEDKNFKVSKTHQPNLFSINKETIISTAKDTHVEKDPLMVTPCNIQHEKIGSVEDMYISSENLSHRIKTKPTQSSSIKWLGTKSEKNEEITADRWPQLPKQEWEQLKEIKNHSVNFWQAQNQVESKFLSDLEQRGKLWNG